MRGTGSRSFRAAALAAMAALLAVRAAGAQGRPRPVVVARLDGTSSSAPRLEGSLGAAVPLGTYARVHLTAGGGAARSRGETYPAARADLIGRFLLDPLKQSARGFYFGGGLSWLSRRGEPGRAWLALVAGMELPAVGGAVPGVEIGLGGGARAGIVVRRGMPNWR